MRSWEVGVIREIRSTPLNAGVNPFGLGQGMGAPGLLVTVDQHILLSVHKQDVHLLPVLLQLRENVRQKRQGLAASDINPHNDPLPLEFLPVRQIHKTFQKLDRQVIHAVIAHILQHFQRRALAGAGHTRQNQQSHIPTPFPRKKFPPCAPPAPALPRMSSAPAGSHPPSAAAPETPWHCPG